RQRPRYVMLNKPSGFITTVKDERQRWTVMDLVDVPERVFPVGRLDRDTQGLLLLTNDGTLANRVMHPRYGLTKEYHVITDVRPSPFQMSRLNDGMFVNGREVIPDECRLLRETAEGIVIKIVLHEGLYHVVRTMMETVGVNVVRLRRVRLGPLRMQGIPPGSWRDLTPGELVQLYEAVGMPVDDADRINQRRPIQLDPVGGFRRGAAEDDSGAAGASRQPVIAPPVRQGSGERARSGNPERTPSGRSAGRSHADDGSRSSSRHRDRRSGRGR
ncbi:MAG: pseudouridine synthase, partial [Chloroflexia bacterium]|nr:pseudouridine synthase [Chloroflexia bacterium]